MHASSSSSSGSFSFAGTEERLYGLVSEQSHTRYPRSYEIYGMSIESTYVHSAANQIAGWKYIHRWITGHTNACEKYVYEFSLNAQIE